MLKLLLAACLVVSSAQAVPETTKPVKLVVEIPVDQIARAKFPNEDGKLVDALASVNDYVNKNMTYVTDQAHYGYEDFWVMAPSDNKGDCEDYAITKLFMLQRSGFPIVSNTKVVAVAVHAEGKLFGHAILAVLLPHGSVMYLDMSLHPMTRDELVAKGYVFFDWKA